MPYAPPAGNGVNFHFAGGYSPPLPAGNHVPFSFGAVPSGGGGGGTGGTAQLPTAMRAARLFGDADDWAWTPRRTFAPPIVAALGPISLRHSGLSRFPLEEPEPWTFRRRSKFAPPARRKRAILFTVT